MMPVVNDAIASAIVLLFAAVFCCVPGYLFLTGCWRRAVRQIARHDSAKPPQMDWPDDPAPCIWRMNLHWRVILYGAPDRLALSSSSQASLQSFQRLAFLVIGVTAMAVLVLFAGLFPMGLVPLAVLWVWVLLRTPDWPKKAVNAA
jgi:hypothetical protein